MIRRTISPVWLCLAMTTCLLAAQATHDLVSRVRASLQASQYREAIDGARRIAALLDDAPTGSDSETAQALDLLVEALLEHGLGSLNATRDLAAGSLQIHERISQPDSAELAAALFRAGEALRLHGELNEARVLYERSLQIRLDTLGAADPLTADSLEGFATTLFLNGDVTTALGFLDNVRTIRQNALGDGSPRLAAGHHRLGDLMIDAGEFETAEREFRQALEIRLQAGPDNLAAAETLHRIGFLQGLQGRLQEARVNLAKALEIRTSKLGEEHPATAETELELAYVLIGDLKRDEARPLLERAAQTRELLLGPQSPALAEALNVLGGLERDDGHFDQAKSLFERALAIRRKVLGSEHPDTVTCMNNLGITLWDLHDNAAAGPLLEEATRGWEKIGNDGGLSVSLQVLAEFKRDSGQFAQAEELYQRAVSIKERLYGTDSPEVGDTLQRLGELLLDQDRYAAAEPYFQRVLKIRLDSGGQHDLMTAAGLDDLGRLRMATGRLPEAVELFQQALDIRRERVGPADARTAVSLSYLAAALQGLGRYSEAGPLLMQALEIRQNAFGADHPETARTLGRIGELKRQTGDLEGARTNFEEALRIFEAFYGPDSIDIANGLRDLANLHREEGQFEKARPLFQRALRITEMRFGAEHPNLSALLNEYAGLLVNLGEYEQARPLLQRATEIAERAYGDNSPLFATSLINLGNLNVSLGNFQKAKLLYTQALEIRRRTLGPRHPEVATILNNLAGLLGRMGDFAQADPLFKEALEIRKEVYGPTHPLVAATLNNYGRFQQETGGEATARDMFEQAISIWEGTLGPDHPDVAVGLSNLASTLTDLSQYGKAMEFYERALQIREKSLGPHHPDVATALNNLAELKKELGDYAGARPLLDRAVQIWREALGPGHPDVATGLSNLASLLVETGDYAEAQEWTERALEIREKALGPNHPDVATSLDDLARLMQALKKPDQALALYRRALTIRETAFGPDNADVAVSLGHLANLLRASGDAEALPLYQRALEIWSRTAGPNSLSAAAVENSLAILHQTNGDTAQALELYRRSLTTWRNLLGENHPNVAVGLYNVAASLAETGRSAEALQDALEAERISRDHLRLTIRTLPERQALRYAAVRVSGKDLALSLALGKSPDASQAVAPAWDAVIRSRALVLDEMAARRRSLINSPDPEVRRLAAQLDQARTELAGLTIRGPGREDPAEYRRRLVEARRAKEAVEQALAATSETARRDQESQSIGLETVLKSIPDDSALLAFVRFRLHRLEGRPASEIAYAAMVARAGSTKVDLISIGPAAEIDPLVEAWHREAASGILRQLWAQTEAQAVYREIGGKLRRRIWDPLTEALGDAKRIFIVPDGAISVVSFQSLPDGDSGYLLERAPLLHYLSAERDLVLLPDRHFAGRGLLAIGGVDFARPNGSPTPSTDASKPRCNQFDLFRFGDLPGAKEEADEVKSIWGDLSGQGEDILELDELNATEQKFKRLAPGRRVLHLATHGFVLGNDCRPEAGRESIASLLEAEAPPPSGEENPLLRSGLALAGANRRSETTGPDDGILTAEEVAALDLSATEWVVLSACSTGVGQVQDGEGVLGLRRSFQVAGAGTLIMSLWPVDDDSTRSLMNTLYKARLQRKMDTPESLRAAALELLRKRREAGLVTHPFFWGAFVAAGDWR